MAEFNIEINAENVCAVFLVIGDIDWLNRRVNEVSRLELVAAVEKALLDSS